MFLPPTSGGIEGTTRFEGVNYGTWWGKDSELNTNHKDVKRRTFTGPENGPYNRRHSADKYVRTTTEN